MDARPKPVRPVDPRVVRRTRIVRRGLGLGGFAVAVAFYCLSLTPSLLRAPGCCRQW